MRIMGNQGNYEKIMGIMGNTLELWENHGNYGKIMGIMVNSLKL